MRLPGFPWRSAGTQRPFEPDFWRVWLVGLVTFIVRWIETVAVGVFVYQRTESAFIVAMITMLRVAPFLFGALLAALADRMEGRTALILVVLLNLAASAAVATLAALDMLAVWHLAVASLINGVGWATDNPVRRVIMGSVVGTDRMSTAVSIDVGSNNVSRVAGPAIGGLLLASVGIVGLFLLDAVLYLVALAAALGLRHRTHPLPQAHGLFLTRMAEGMALAIRDRRLRGTLLLTMIYNVFGWPFTSMIPVIGQDNLKLGAEGIGILASLDGLGALFGAVAVAIYGRAALYARIYIGGVVLYLAALTLFALAPQPVLAGTGLLLAGAGNAAFAIMQATLIYVIAPYDMRGRLLGVLTTCIGIGPVGFVGVGLLAEAIGAKWAVSGMGVTGLTVLALTYPIWKHIGAPADDAGAAS